MGGIDDDGIDASLYESLCTLKRVFGDTHTGCHTQTALVILAGIGLVLGLGDVLVGDQTDEVVLGIHHRQFLNLVLLQNLSGVGQVGLLMRGHQILLGHHVIDQLVKMTLETQVTVGDDTHEDVVLIHHGDTANMIFSHHTKGIGYCLTTANGHGIVDHTVLGTLDNGYLTSLLLNGHVLVNDANTSLTGNGNSHRRLGNRVHSSRHKRYIELNVTGELRL